MRHRLPPHPDVIEDHSAPSPETLQEIMDYADERDALFLRRLACGIMLGAFTFTVIICLLRGCAHA